MDKRGPIVLIDDDEDDLQLLIEIFADMNLQNEVHLFRNTSSVIAFLQRDDINPFLIISDINMPVMSGFQLQYELSTHPVISRKKIPYLFFSTLTGINDIPRDPQPANQGIFRKPSRKSEWREVLETIVKYWTFSLSSDTEDSDPTGK